MAGASLCWRPGGDGAGLGVFAERDLKAGDLVERCHCLPLRPSAVPSQQLRSWLYDRGLGGDEPLLFPLGWGLLYNGAAPSAPPNVAWEYGPASAPGCLELRAQANVPAGQELLVARGGRDVLSRAVEAVRAEPGTELPAAAVGPEAECAVLRSAGRDSVEMRASPVHGNGVFARRAIRKGEVVEISPNLLATRWALGHCLVDHRFGAFAGYEEAGGADASRVRPLVLKIALGLGSVFNHHDEPNVGYRPARTSAGSLEAQRFMTCYHALRDIAEGEELFISYGAAWWKSRAPETVSLGEWRRKRGETEQGRPFYDAPDFEARTGLNGAAMEELHQAFVDAEDGEENKLEGWKAVCAELAKAGIAGCLNAPLRDSGERCTHRAAQHGRLQNLRWLILNGADVNAATAPALDLSPAGDASSALCPAHVAAIYGQVEALQALQSAGADLNCKRPDGATPLDFAKDTEQAAAAAWLALRGGVSGLG